MMKFVSSLAVREYMSLAITLAKGSNHFLFTKQTTHEEIWTEIKKQTALINSASSTKRCPKKVELINIGIDILYENIISFKDRLKAI